MKSIRGKRSFGSLMRDLISNTSKASLALFKTREIVDVYNATIQNNREIDRVHNYELYIATVSIKHKSVDRIKTALRFWFNAT